MATERLLNGEPHPARTSAVRAVLELLPRRPLRLARRILSALHPRPRQIHLLVIDIDMRRAPEAGPLPSPPAGIEFRRVAGERDPYVDAIAAVDEWKTSRTDVIARLRQGHNCHIATLDGKVVAVGWTTGTASYFDPVLDRELVLAPHQTYGFGAHSVPALRGKNLMPALVAYANADLVENDGKTTTVCLIRWNNRRSIRAMEKVGSIRRGRLGFVQVYGWRLHYLTGGKALSEMRRRIDLRRAPRSGR